MRYYHTHISQAVEIESEVIELVRRDKSILKSTKKVRICPECNKHNQTQKRHIQQGSHYAYDCKNLFYEWHDREGNVIPPEHAMNVPNRVMHTVGQCCCYSFQHGVRINRKWDLEDLYRLIPHLTKDDQTIVRNRCEEYKKRGY